MVRSLLSSHECKETPEQTLKKLKTENNQLMEYTAKQEQTIRDKEQENILLKQQNAKYEQTLNAKDQEI